MRYRAQLLFGVAARNIYFMERHGFNPSSHETSDIDTDDSSEKDTDNSKKKKSTAERPTPDSKKEQVAARTKELLDAFVRNSSETEPAKAPGKSAAETEHDASKTPEQAEPLPEEQLTPEEQLEVIAAYAPARIAELKAGRSEAEDPADAAAREADIAYLESLLSEEELEPAEEADDDMPLEVMDQAEAAPEEAQELSADEAVMLVPRSPMPQAGGSGSTPPPRGNSRSGASGPTGRSGSGGTGLPALSWAPARQAPQLERADTPVPTSAERPGYQPDYQQNPNATYLLVGGIVGYFIGRRRGRIKTEKRLKTVQQKLEQQVVAIQHEVAQKEKDVQHMAREQYQLQKRAEASKYAAPQQNREASVPSRRTPERPTTVVESRTNSTREALPAERSKRSEPEKAPQLSKEQLLQTSEKIRVGSTNLKRIYEAKLISESGLKRLVGEYLEHRDIRRGLAREFLAKELSYERDPHFRDLLPPESNSQSSSSAAVAVDQDSRASSATAAGLATASSKPSPTAKPSGKSSVTQVPTGVLAALTLIALALAIYAVLLGLSR